MPMRIAASMLGALLLDGAVLGMGDYDDASEASAELYDPGAVATASGS